MRSVTTAPSAAMKQRLRRVDSFEDIKKAGLFRGVGILQAGSGVGV